MGPSTGVQQDFWLRFWGVRGSIACPGPDTMRYGGNTSCVEVRCGPHLFILDGGTGLRPLGERLTEAGPDGTATCGPVDADILFTHTHFDHICGLPFFAPVFRPEHKFRLWAGHLLPELTLRDVLCHMMMAPLFPVPIEVFRADVSFHDFRAGEPLALRPGVTIRTMPLNHPDRSTGYRIEYGGRSICYVTDTEHREGGLDPAVLELIAGADIFIYDATYTDAEYPERRGWGHSTWEEGARLADAAGVRTYVVFHHDPGHGDRFMDSVSDAVATRRPGSVVAREGLILRP